MQHRVEGSEETPAGFGSLKDFVAQLGSAVKQRGSVTRQRHNRNNVEKNCVGKWKRPLLSAPTATPRELKYA